ncbi:MAG: DsrE family protein, partial [bacterium]
MAEENNRELLVMWTSGEAETARNMVFMYTLNARLQGWWDEVTLLVWGAASRLLTEDDYLKSELAKMQQAGVKTIACRSCAEKMDVAEQLKALDIKVFYT